jgi:prepilin-type processing-associated H-X9-DG protein
MNMYSNDYGEFYPTMGVDVPTVSATEGRNQRTLASLSLLFPDYHSARKCFWCPSTDDDPSGITVGRSFTPSQCSFAYDSQKGVLTNPGVPIMADKPARRNGWNRNSGNHHNLGQNVLYYDGHVEWRTNNAAGLNGDNIYSFRTPCAVVAVTDSFITQN